MEKRTPDQQSLEARKRYAARKRGEDVPLRIANQPARAFEYPATKTCARCRREKSSDEFPRIRGGRYLHSYCRQCCAAGTRQQYQKNREQHLASGRERYWRDPEKSRAYERERRLRNPGRGKASKLRAYGLTMRDYEALRAEQGGGCAICGAQNDSGYDLAVDHDHSDGSVRGLLCRKCNVGLGLFRDAPQLLAAAIAYLTAPPAPVILQKGGHVDGVGDLL